MKLTSFTANGKAGFGIVVEDGIVDLTRRMQASGLKDALEHMPEIRAHAGAPADLKLSEVTFLPVIPDPQKIICVGINYASHVQETGRDMPEKPFLFVRFANSQTAHEQPIIRPVVSENLDFEGELAVVIGRRCRHVPRATALDVVAGYSCYNDASVRDWQRHSTQLTPGKNFPSTGAFGPWLVTTDELPDVASQTLVTRLNGAEMQRGKLDDLIFNVPYLVEYCSTFTELLPGDVIATGTTGGVGWYRKPSVWMKPGDVVEVEISGIGTLRNTVVAE